MGARGFPDGGGGASISTRTLTTRIVLYASKCVSRSRVVVPARGWTSARARWIAFGAAVALAVVFAAARPRALYRDGDLWPKSADGVTRIPICFIVTGELTAAEDAAQRTLIKEVLAATWGRWTKIEFSGFGTCPNPPGNATLAIALEGEEMGGAGDIPDQDKHTGGHRGFQGASTPTWGKLWIKGTTDLRARAVITHEIGHGLAFEHEQSRPDAAGFCPDGDEPLDGTIITPEYDDVAIMSYCGPGPYLSRLDIRGAQSLYGTSAAGQWLNALPAITHLP